MATSVPARPPLSEAPYPDFTRAILGVVRDQHEQRGWSLYRLIRVSGLDMTRAYRWFRCGYSPTLDELVIIAAALDVPLADLVATAERRYKEAAL